MDATYALLLVDDDPRPHLGSTNNGNLLCGRDYKGSTQAAICGGPTSTTCLECARVAAVVRAL